MRVRHGFEKAGLGKRDEFNTMKPLLLAGLALAVVVPAWSQIQGQNRPPAPPNDRMAPPDDDRRGDGPPRANEPPVGGPIQLRGPRRGGYDNGPPIDGRPEFAPPPPPPTTMFADERFLYVLRGDTLMKFDKSNLTLLQSVELPRPIRPAQGGGPFEGSLRSRTSPPLLRRQAPANPPTF